MYKIAHENRQNRTSFQLNALLSLTLFLFGTLFPSAFAQNNSSNFSFNSLFFKQISIGNGLSQSSAQSMFRDGTGCLWIATKYGLNRYDFQNIKTYYSEEGNSNTIPNNDVKNVFGDSQGNVWAICQKGVAKYDSFSDTFVQVMLDNALFNARSYYETKDGIYFGGGGAVLFYDFKSESIKKIPTKGGSTLFYNGIQKFDDNQLVLSTRWDGLWIFDKRNNTIKRLAITDEKEITMMTKDIIGRLWISVYDKGLECYSKDGVLVAKYNTLNSNLNNDVVLCSAENNGVMYFGTDGGGVNIFNINDESINSILNNPIHNNSVYSANTVLSLYVDADKNLWAGTNRGGAICIQDVNMHTYTGTNNDDFYGPNAYPITKLIDDNNIIWISTDGGGINMFNKETGKFAKFPNTNGLKITSIANFGSNSLLASVFSKGLYLFNKSTHSLSSADNLIKNQSINVLNKSLPVDIHNDDKGHLFIYSDKFNVLDIASKKIHTVPYDYENSHLGMLNCFYSDNSQALMFSLTKILRYEPKSDKLIDVVEVNKTRPITCAQFNGAENIYLGTNAGLLCYNTKTKELTELGKDLIKNVSSMIYDNGRLWIGADNALYCFNTEAQKIISFGQSDGVETNEFIYKATLATNDGIYIGGVNGLLRIDRNIYSNLSEKNYNVALNLTELEIDGTSSFADIKDGTIDISPSHSMINIKIIANEKNIFRKQLFRYTIEGLNNVFQTYDRSLSLNILPPGIYTIKVSCLSQSGVWTPPTTILKIHVLHPWYLRWWSILLFIFILTASSYYIIQYINNKKKDKEMIRIKEVERNSYEKKVNFLINVNHELRTPLTLIAAPLKRILKNISKGQDVGDISEQLSAIYKQSKKMKNVINMILDLRRLETGHTDLHIENVDFNTWAKDVTDDFRNEYKHKDIEIILKTCNDLGIIPMDKEKCEIILSNFMMNALKHSPANTKVIVTTNIVDGYARISVADEGIGLRGVDTNRLFERFYQGNDATSGSGIGLNYSKTLVELQNGHIGAEPNQDKGANFWFEIPTAFHEAAINTVDEQIDLLEQDQTYSYKIDTDDAFDFDGSHMTIVVVDDDADMCKYIASVMKDKFGRVIKAYNGKEALQLIKSTMPDLIVSDVMIPQMNGIELCHTVKNTDKLKHIPVLLLTARISQDMTSDSYRMGADAYLTKPFDTDELLAICMNLIKNRLNMRNRYIGNAHMGNEESHSKQETMNNAEDDFIVRINTIIKQNISNAEFNVEDIVEKMLVSRTTLYSRVKDLTGKSIGDLIADHRYNEAKRLLTETTKPLSEISSSLGFSSQRYFSTAFKAKFGETPSEYRRTRTPKADS